MKVEITAFASDNLGQIILEQCQTFLSPELYSKAANYYYEAVFGAVAQSSITSLAEKSRAMDLKSIATDCSFLGPGRTVSSYPTWYVFDTHCSAVFDQIWARLDISIPILSLTVDDAQTLSIAASGRGSAELVMGARYGCHEFLHQVKVS